MSPPNTGIVLTVYDEPFDMVNNQVCKLKELYVNPTIVLCYDGVDVHPIEGVTHVKFLERLKTKHTVGLWTESWMKAFLNNTSCDYMLKLDPDTILLKPVEYWPVGEIVFGTIKERQLDGGHDFFRIHGGGCGYSRSVVQKIVDCEWLLAPRYINSIQFQDQEDVMIAHMIRFNGLRYLDHPEFDCGRPIKPTTSIGHL